VHASAKKKKSNEHGIEAASGSIGETKKKNWSMSRGRYIHVQSCSNGKGP
jgi:hypothetical protein